MRPSSASVPQTPPSGPHGPSLKHFPSPPAPASGESASPAVSLGGTSPPRCGSWKKHHPTMPAGKPLSLWTQWRQLARGVCVCVCVTLGAILVSNTQRGQKLECRVDAGIRAGCKRKALNGHGRCWEGKRHVRTVGNLGWLGGSSIERSESRLEILAATEVFARRAALSKARLSLWLQHEGAAPLHGASPEPTENFLSWALFPLGQRL